MKKYSRQREAILSVLRSTDAHPTAGLLYERVRESIPNISLGTVYRNLSELCRTGEIISIPVSDGFEHFDADTSPHVHLHCTECGGIFDAELEEGFLERLEDKNAFDIKAQTIIVYGICKNCKAEIN